MHFLSTRKVKIPAEPKLCQREETVIIQVRGERVLSGNWLKGERQSDRKKQEVKDVKRVEKNVQES